MAPLRASACDKSDDPEFFSFVSHFEKSVESLLTAGEFHARDGVLIPLPIEGAASVDQRRTTLGLPPLVVYARQLRRRSS